MPFRLIGVPLARVMLPMPSRLLDATAPIVQSSWGPIASNWARRYLWQARISSLLGTRFEGGLHFTTFVMKTSDLDRPASPRSSSRNRPAAPTKGLPWRSSFAPGASPTRTIHPGGPSPGTGHLRPSESRQEVHRDTSAAISARARRGSGFPTDLPLRGI